jgi:hypothetical protein
MQAQFSNQKYIVFSEQILVLSEHTPYNLPVPTPWTGCGVLLIGRSYDYVFVELIS